MDINGDIHATGDEMLDVDEMSPPHLGPTSGRDSTTNPEAETESPAVVPCQHSSAPSHIGASSSVNAPAVLDLRPTTPPRGNLQGWGGGSSCQPDPDKGKGKGKEIGLSSKSLLAW